MKMSDHKCVALRHKTKKFCHTRKPFTGHNVHEVIKKEIVHETHVITQQPNPLTNVPTAQPEKVVDSPSKTKQAEIKNTIHKNSDHKKREPSKLEEPIINQNKNDKEQVLNNNIIYNELNYIFVCFNRFQDFKINQHKQKFVVLKIAREDVEDEIKIGFKTFGIV